jgi:phage tail sheath protein FI
MTELFLHGVEVLNIDDGVRTIRTASSSVIGLVGTAPRADAAAFPLNTPVLVTSRVLAAKLLTGTGSDNGTLPAAIDGIFDQSRAVIVVVRVDVGADDAETEANMIGGVNSTTGQFEGVHALLGADSALGVKPRILVAPGFTHQRDTTANAVVAELIGIADRLRAVIIQDGPSTTDAAAIVVAGDAGSKRVFLVDPRVLIVNDAGATVADYASARVAGLIARSDNERGFWWSPSNQVMNGVVGVERAIDFSIGDATSRANLLNAANVATIVRQNGLRLWGNRTLSDDAKWAFLCVVRTADIIADSLQDAHLWAVDRGITKNYVVDVQEGVNAFLRDLKAKGAIAGGNCWLDPDLNTAENIAAGRVYWDFDFTPTYPAERLTFRSHLVDNYLTEIF